MESDLLKGIQKRMRVFSVESVAYSKKESDAEHTARGPVLIAHDFCTLRILPIQVPNSLQWMALPAAAANAGR